MAVIFSTPGTVSAFCSTSDTSLSTRSGLAPGYTVTTIRYGVLTSGSRFVCIFVMATKPKISTMITATRTVNGFLTLNFSIISYRFSAGPLAGQPFPSPGMPHFNKFYYTRKGRPCKQMPESFAFLLTLSQFFNNCRSVFPVSGSGCDQIRSVSLSNTLQNGGLLHPEKILPPRCTEICVEMCI